MATVIVGGDVIGSAIAFYLTELEGADPSSIYIIESSSVPAAALGALSFDLHKELAAKYDGFEAWGYSSTTSCSSTSSKTSKRGEDWLFSGSRASMSKVTHEIDSSDHRPVWLKRADGEGLDTIGGDTTAQVLVFFLLFD